MTRPRWLPLRRVFKLMLARCLNHSYSDLEIVSISQAGLKASVMNLILTKIRESYLDKISLFKNSQLVTPKVWKIISPTQETRKWHDQSSSSNRLFVIQRFTKGEVRYEKGKTSNLNDYSRRSS